MSNLGNTSVSALLSSAASTANQLADLEDKKQADLFKYSDQGDGSYNDYKTYLEGRIKQLQGEGSISAQSKAESLIDSSINLDRTYRSQKIQDASMGILEGSYSGTQKEQLLRDLAVKAYQSGDPQNGQSIEMMYDRQVLSNQAAAEAAQRAAEAGDTKAQNALAKSYNDLASPLETKINQGEALFQSGKISEKDYVNLMAPLYNAVGQIYNEAQNNTGLRDDQINTFQNKTANLQKSGNYELLVNPTIATKLANGENIFHVTTDAGTGVKKLAVNSKAIVGQTITTDKTGSPDKNSPDYNPNYGKPYTKDLIDLTNKSDLSKTMDVSRDNGTTQERYYPEMIKDPKTGQMVPDTTGKSGYYYIDSVTGKKVDVNPATNEHMLAEPGKPNVFASGGLMNPSLSQKLDNSEFAATTGLTSQRLGGALHAARTGLTNFAVNSVPGLSILDSLHHAVTGSPADASLGFDHMLGTVSHFLTNPISGGIDMVGDVLHSAQARQAKFQAQANLAKQQMAAINAAHQNYATALAGQAHPTGVQAPTSINPATGTFNGSILQPSQAVMAAYNKAAHTVGTPEFNNLVGESGLNTVKPATSSSVLYSGANHAISSMFGY